MEVSRSAPRNKIDIFHKTVLTVFVKFELFMEIIAHIETAYVIS
jgi:hypothetical protein